MIYEVNITERALLDMRTIYEYIADKLMEPIIAEKQYTRIEKSVYSLNQMPERFRRYEKEPWRSRNLRVMPIDNYIAYYIVDTEDHKESVVRIMYGRRDTEKELDAMVQQEN